MKPLVLKTLIISLTYLFLIPLCGQLDDNYTEKDFRRDSAYLRYLDQKGWDFYNSNKMDSLFYLIENNFEVAERALAFRVDTFLLGLYKFSRVNYGIVMALHFGEMEKGMKIAEAAYEEGLNDPRLKGFYGAATTANSMSTIYHRLGDYEKVLFNYRRSLETKNEIYEEGHHMLANQFLNFYLAFSELGDYSRAEYYLLKSLETIKLTYPSIAQRRKAYLATLYYKQGDKEKAFGFLEKEIQNFEFEKPEDPYNKAAYLGVLGDLYELEQDYELSEKAYTKKLDLLQNLPKVLVSSYGERFFIQADISYSYYKIGKNKYEKGAYKEAIELLQKAFQSQVEFAGPGAQNLSKIKLNLTLAYSKTGRTEEAKNNLKDAFSRLGIHEEFFKTSGSDQIANIWPTSEILEAFFIKAKIFQNLSAQESKYANAAAESFLSVENLIDKMSQYLGHSTTNVITLKNVVRKYYEQGILFFLQQYEDQRDPLFLEHAFRLIEKSKASSLLLALLSSNAREFHQIPQSLLERERETNLYLSFSEKELFNEENKGTEADKDKLVELASRVNRYKIRKDSILNIFQKDHPDYFKLKYQLDIPSIKDVQAYLRKKDRGMIQYFLGKENLVTFIITPQKVIHFIDPINQNDLEEEIYQDLKSLKQPNFEKAPEQFHAFVRAGYDWYRELHLGELAGLGVENVLIIPDGALSLIPFHLLMTEEVGQQYSGYQQYPYLFFDQVISVDYSATVHMLAGQKKKLSSFSYMGFAPLYRSGSKVRGLEGEEAKVWNGSFPLIARDGVDSLQFNRTEVQECAVILDGIPYINESASERRFKQSSSNVGILHLAMHAFLDDVNPLYSQLAFDLNGESSSDEDGLLYAYELYNTRLNADLAILSACNTGAGRVAKGEGVMSLSHAFKYAGCPNVVLNFWLANDKSAKDLVVSFARHLKDGKGKAEALNEARKEYLQSAAESDAHPYFWGGLTLIGDDEPIKEAGSRHWLIVLPLLGLFLLVAGWKKFGERRS